jgi:hypothetical protein
MAATDYSTQTSPQVTTMEGRQKLARLVVVGSFLTLFLLVATLIVLAQGDNATASETAKNAFTAVLPVLAGWVGTVLAFYFSAASQERASASLDKAIARGAGGGSTTLVSEKMIPYSAIVKRLLGDVDGKPVAPKDILIADLEGDFAQKLPGGGNVTRLFFVDKGVFKYVLHKATLDAFKLKSPGGADFAAMLTDEETLRQISKLVVFVSAGTTVADGKTALDKVNGAQDIVVTGSGNSTEPMLGWLSNVDLIKAIEVT